MYHSKLPSLVWTRHDGVRLRGSNMAAVIEWKHLEFTWLSQRLSSLFWACKYSHRCFSCDVGFSDLSRTRWINVFMYVTCLSADIFMSCTVKKSKIQTALFSKQSMLRAENMQADTFLKCLLCDEVKNGKVSLLLNFNFLWPHLKTKNFSQLCL